MQERAYDNPKIKFHLNTQVESIEGDGRVEKVVLKNSSNDEKETLNVGGVFVAIGHVPNTEMFSNQIEMDKRGYIVQKEHSQTSVPGVFTAGDVHDSRYRQAVTAHTRGVYLCTLSSHSIHHMELWWLVICSTNAVLLVPR